MALSALESLLPILVAIGLALLTRRVFISLGLGLWAGCLVAKGWNPAIEHVEPENATGHYWYMWKIPMFGERNVEGILRPHRIPYANPTVLTCCSPDHALQT